MSSSCERPSALGERLLWFSDGELTPDGASSVVPAVIDSWLLENGRVRGLDLHEARFRGSCLALLPSLSELVLEEFFGAVRSCLPGDGRWFPRIEAYAGIRPMLALRLRPAPPYTGAIALWIPSHPDPRSKPAVKGPDLQALAALRGQARDAGADDAVLYTSEGIVLETAHAALLWWRGERLCVPAADLAVLPSVTRTLVSAVAQNMGIEVIHERCHIDELVTLPSWTVNALHGIRSVDRWVRDR